MANLLGTSGGKRERLVAAAREVMHQQGVERTTLADIAQTADVPLGNVYYYFKTKDDLIAAMIEDRLHDLEAALRSLERHRTPRARLKAFIKLFFGHPEVAARYGCPAGSLSSELGKREDPAARASARLLQLPIGWLEKQFSELGRPDAPELAIALMSSYEGAALLTNTLRDPKLMTTESRRLERWIDSLS
jgi:AcrR family transcriptional regulator